MTEFTASQFGESFIGDGADAAHINTVLGGAGGPVETAWVTALATPSAGHAAFVAVVAPGVAVRPHTLFVNKAAIAGDLHGRLTWGAAQAGVAGGVLDAVAAAVIDERTAAEGLLIVAVWVNPAATNEEAVYANNRTATFEALRAGRDGRPTLPDALAGRHAPHNGFFAGPAGHPVR
ncbi:MAG TPA: formaldehyde-activating enzyme [Acidimicrobiales bacterium]|nr:formaldehyde-activating enzyme [Acidimicrobiales bacterium]